MKPISLSPNTINLNGKVIPYTLRFSERAKRRRITAGPKGIEVILPHGDKVSEVAPFLQKHATWVLRQLAKQATAHAAVNPNGEKPPLLLRGVETQIEVVESATERGTVRVEEKTGCLILHAPKSAAQERQIALEAWLIDQAAAELTQRVKERSQQMQVQPGKLYVRAQRSKWGSCSSTKNLSFNWRLILAPPAVLDYVVVHELAHLRQLNHSPEFWQIVRAFCPEYEKHRRWLKEHGMRLLGMVV